MTPGFQVDELIVATRDGRNCKNAIPAQWCHPDGRLFRIPTAGISDGASVPRICDILLDLPPYGEYWMEAYLHDQAYDGGLEIYGADGNWTPAMLPKDECDFLFKQAMALNPAISNNKAMELYIGVKLGGQAAFNEDRAAYAARQGSKAPFVSTLNGLRKAAKEFCEENGEALLKAAGM